MKKKYVPRMNAYTAADGAYELNTLCGCTEARVVSSNDSETVYSFGDFTVKVAGKDPLGEFVRTGDITAEAGEKIFRFVMWLLTQPKTERAVPKKEPGLPGYFDTDAYTAKFGGNGDILSFLPKDSAYVNLLNGKKIAAFCAKYPENTPFRTGAVLRDSGSDGSVTVMLNNRTAVMSAQKFAAGEFGQFFDIENGSFSAAPKSHSEIADGVYVHIGPRAVTAADCTGLGRSPKGALLWKDCTADAPKTLALAGFSLLNRKNPSEMKGSLYRNGNTGSSYTLKIGNSENVIHTSEIQRCCFARMM